MTEERKGQQELLELLRMMHDAKEQPHLLDCFVSPIACGNYFNISELSVRRYIKKGELQAMKFEKDFKIKIRSILNFENRFMYRAESNNEEATLNEIKDKEKRKELEPMNWEKIQNHLDEKDGSE